MSTELQDEKKNIPIWHPMFFKYIFKTTIYCLAVDLKEMEKKYILNTLLQEKN